MAEFLHEPRFVYVVCDPVRRAVGHWAEQLLFRREERSLDEALDVDDPANPYVCSSRYASQLDRYRACFPEDRILVLDQRDLRERRHQTLRQVYAFAGVDPDFVSPGFDQEPNAADTKVRLNKASWWLARHGLVPVRIREPLARSSFARLLGRPFERPELEPPQRDTLIEALRDDIARFRQMTGMAFAGWPV
jgi:hypothetical protein